MQAGPMNIFFEGGWAMWAVLATGVPAWFFTLIAGGVLVFKRERFPLVLAGLFPLLCGLLAVILGAVGYFSGMSMAEQAIAMADPQHREMLLAEGARMAKYPLYFGLFVGTIPTLVGGLCLALALTLRKSD